MAKEKVSGLEEDSEGVAGEPPILAIGQIVGGPSEGPTQWSAAVRIVSRSVEAQLAGAESPLNLDVVYIIEGEFLIPEFEGVRTGRFSRKHNLLSVQIALPTKPTESETERLRAVLSLLVDAIEAAEQAGVRRRILSHPLVELREIASRATGAILGNGGTSTS